jgi:hypothetical protein
MTRTLRAALFASVALSATARAHPAFAQDAETRAQEPPPLPPPDSPPPPPVTTAEPKPIPPPPEEKTEKAAENDKPPVEPERERSMGVLLNPVQLLTKTLSVDFVWTPVAHHAVVINPRLRPIDGVRFSGELGYRFYSSQARQPSGFFGGPSLGLLYSSEGSLLTLAADIGVQIVSKIGVTAAVGVGLMWIPAGTKVKVGPSELGIVNDKWYFAPRMLGAIGYAF